MRYLVGGICLLLSLVFLGANTAILGRYGWKSGGDDLEMAINMVVAGSVPTALAAMPFLIMATWQAGHYVIVRTGKRKWKRGRPSPIVLVGFLLYGVFVAFNFMGAIGSIALQKNEFVDRREGMADDTKRAREAREQKRQQLANLNVNRPADAVRAELEGARIHRFWSATSECREATSKAHSKFCGSVASWKKELSSAEVADKLRAEIDELDRKLSSPAAHIGSTDPQGETLAYYAGKMLGQPVTAGDVRLVQPLIWFLLLELSCMFMFYMTLQLFGIGHASFQPAPATAVDIIPPSRGLASPRPAALRAEPLPAATDVVTATPISGEDPELQAAVYERWWADCTRRMPGAQIAATAAYASYRAYCGRPENNVIAYPFGEFSRRSGEHVSHTSTVGGVQFLLGVAMAEPMGGQ